MTAEDKEKLEKVVRQRIREVRARDIVPQTIKTNLAIWELEWFLRVVLEVSVI